MLLPLLGIERKNKLMSKTLYGTPLYDISKKEKQNGKVWFPAWSFVAGTSPALAEKGLRGSGERRKGINQRRGADVSGHVWL